MTGGDCLCEPTPLPREGADVACRICFGREGVRHRAREMMFGLRDEFEYLECAGCGCLQLLDPPAEMGRYYPSHYYSYGPAPRAAAPPRRAVREWAFRKRNEAQLFGRRGFWGLVARLRGRPDLAPLAALLRPTGLRSLGARVLDVGCGSGALLRDLAGIGFRSLLGLDPHLAADVEYGPECRVLARPLTAVADRAFDLIMFHHSLEHMPDSVAALALASRMLAPDGVCLVRIPLASSEPWKEYGTAWVELDAPRHYFVHSRKSLELAARRSGLAVYHVTYDSIALSYWGSELYRRGIPLHDAARRSLRDPRSVFTDAELAEFESRAAVDNARGVAGRGVFYLRRSGAGEPPNEGRS